MGNIFRPDWTKTKYGDTKIDLSSNLPYNPFVYKKISEIISSKDFNVRLYTDEVIAYDALEEHYNIPKKNTALGYGLGELMPRIVKQFENKTWSIPGDTWKMVPLFFQMYDVNHTNEYDETADILYLVNPNGLNGTWMKREEVIKTFDKFELVIVDECYGDFCDKDFSVLDQYNNCVIFKNVSKSLGLAGLRLGWAFGPESFISEIQMVRPSCSAASLSVDILPDILPLISKNVYDMKITKRYIENNKDCLPSEGNYVLLRNPGTYAKMFTLGVNNDGISRMALLNIETLKLMESNYEV